METAAQVQQAQAAVLTAQGSYTRALELAEQARVMAEETEHRQWITAANRTIGAIYFDLLDMPQAMHHFEQALTLAREIGSLHWIRVTAGSLALAHLLQKHLTEAESQLNAMAPDLPMISVGTRLVWLARAEFQLAQGDANRALDIAERLIASAANLEGGQRVIPRLWKLRGDALAMLGNTQAGSVLRAARDAAAEQGSLPLLWRIELSLGRLSPKANAEHFEAARKVIEQLAHNITDEARRDNFVQRAFALLPGATVPSPRQIAKKQYGGLTTREREIAGMIAHGKSNREIADVLVVSERTVETHVGNILAKLGFGSRSQIAAWATETGLR